jgi:hypothetical protein
MTCLLQTTARTLSEPVYSSPNHKVFITSSLELRRAISPDTHDLGDEPYQETVPVKTMEGFAMPEQFNHRVHGHSSVCTRSSTLLRQKGEYIGDVWIQDCRSAITLFVSLEISLPFSLPALTRAQCPSQCVSLHSGFRNRDAYSSESPSSCLSAVFTSPDIMTAHVETLL